MRRLNNGTTIRSSLILSLTCLGLMLAGSAGAAGSFSQQCESLTKDNMVVVIRDNHFNRGWYETVIGIDVSPDGTFHQTQMITVGRRQAVVQVNGKITGASFEGDIGTDACAAHLSLTKS
jgi:hypothetical protein